jgi:integrase
MLGGIRTEEARALRWSEVDLEAGTGGRLLIDTAHRENQDREAVARVRAYEQRKQ